MNTYKRFAKYSKHYHRVMVHSDIIFPPHIYKKITQLMRGSILDVGSGSGKKLESLIQGSNLESIKKIAAIDPSPLYEEARLLFRDNKKVTVLHKSLEDLKDKEKFDIILMFEVLEHLESPNKILKKIKYMLKDNGVFIASIPNRLIFDLTGWLSREERDETHISEMSYRQFKLLIQKHFAEFEFIGIPPLMFVYRRLPLLSFLTKFSVLPLSRTIYCFAKNNQ
jgi:2-polyprenyl-3-methyl-5-hydroxy-6-metoxy-1,4-benzoquinol methylase